MTSSPKVHHVGELHNPVSQMSWQWKHQQTRSFSSASPLCSQLCSGVWDGFRVWNNGRIFCLFMRLRVPLGDTVCSPKHFFVATHNIQGDFCRVNFPPAEPRQTQNGATRWPGSNPSLMLNVKLLLSSRPSSSPHCRRSSATLQRCG